MKASPAALPEHVRRRGHDIVVERGERARREPRVERAGGRDHHPGQRCRGRLLGDRRLATREHPGDRVGRDERRHEQRHGDHGDGQRGRDDVAAEPSLVARPREGRQHGDADRRRRQHDHDEDPVGGEEAVRLGAPAELACEHQADDRREPGLHGQRDGGDGPRAERAKSG